MNGRPPGYEPDELPDCSTPLGTAYNAERLDYNPSNQDNPMAMICPLCRNTGVIETAAISVSRFCTCGYGTYEWYAWNRNADDTPRHATRETCRGQGPLVHAGAPKELQNP